MGKNKGLMSQIDIEKYFQLIGIPILGRIEGTGTLEGGDIIWIDKRTVAVGEGYRSNAEGIRSAQTSIRRSVDECHTCSSTTLDRCRLSPFNEHYFTN